MNSRQQGSCIASLGIVFPTEVLSSSHLPFYKQQLQNAAFQLSTQMGYLGYMTPPAQDIE